MENRRLGRKERFALGGESCAIEVRPSEIHGNGIFATRPILKNELVTFYDGEHVDWQHARTLADPSYVRGVAHGYTAIDGLRTPQRSRGAGSFCNHSDRPNALFWVRDDVVWIKAARDIEPGAEVLVSYGRNYWRRFADASKNM